MNRIDHIEKDKTSCKYVAIVLFTILFWWNVFWIKWMRYSYILWFTVLWYLKYHYNHHHIISRRRSTAGHRNRLRFVEQTSPDHHSSIGLWVQTPPWTLEFSKFISKFHFKYTTSFKWTENIERRCSNLQSQFFVYVNCPNITGSARELQPGAFMWGDLCPAVVRK